MSSFNASGVWAIDAAGTLGLVLRRGDIVEAAPDELRRVEGIQFATKHVASSAQTGFNDVGELALAVRFTDQSEAILVATPIAPGDIDLDGDVDLADYLALEACFSGAGNPAAEDCKRCDFDDDNDVDLADLIAFQAVFTGAR